MDGPHISGVPTCSRTDVGAQPSGMSLWGRWRSFRLRTKVLLVVGALILFGALMPGEDSTPEAGADQAPRTSDSGASAVEEEGTADEDEDAEADAVAEETEETVVEEVVEEISVPALRSQSVDQARSALRRAGLEVEIVRKPSWDTAGQVLRQGTKAGVALLAGTVVTLVVASPMPRVPGLLGRGAAVGRRHSLAPGSR